MRPLLARPLLLLLLVSCASRNPRSIVDEVSEDNISVQSVLDLARNSYLKGCVDSKNRFSPDTGGSVFNTCVDMAKEHQEEIRYILEQNVDSKPTK